MKRKADLVQTRRSNASNLHRRTLELVKELYPGFDVSEEQTIDVVLNGHPTKLFIDIVIKKLRVCIECQGRQHTEFNAHFHRGDEDNFKAQKKKDKAKAEAIVACNYVLVQVFEHEIAKLTKAKLSKRITKALRS